MALIGLRMLMPLQNRVTPWGAIVAAEGRGLLMGNRGILHNEQRQVVRRALRSAPSEAGTRHRRAAHPAVGGVRLPRRLPADGSRERVQPNELLSEAGLGGVSVDAVSKRSGVAKTTIYRHWPSRTAL